VPMQRYGTSEKWPRPSPSWLPPVRATSPARTSRSMAA
jgi:hypothetical protein